MKRKNIKSSEKNIPHPQKPLKTRRSFKVQPGRNRKSDQHGGEFGMHEGRQ
jgi:hypothetical protein